MTDRQLARKKAIIRRNLFLGTCALVLVLIIALMVFIISAITKEPDVAPSSDAQSSQVSSDNSSDEIESDVSSEAESQAESKTESQPESSKSETVSKGNVELDADYERLLLVNGENSLPEDFDYEGNLLTVDKKYINGSLRQIDKDVWPYMRAMIEAAWEDGVDLYIWSPYRSYATQKMLYENQVKREMDKGLDRKAAEDKAATVVARPGTSEHHTGLAADFNMASDAFENTEMYKWMSKNAADYGFIMRYSEEKQPITGVIHESWHWRFVGINHALKIKELDMCLEEYLDYIGVSNKVDTDSAE